MQNEQIYPQFIASHSMKSHPLVRARKKTKLIYYAVLEYLAGQFSNRAEYTAARLKQYREMLVGSESTVALTDDNRDRSIRSIVNDWLRPWKRNHYIWLMCDIALVMADKSAIEQAQAAMSAHLSKKKRALLGDLIAALLTDVPIHQDLLLAESWIQQFRANRILAEQPEMRILVTANMSAGKSTLINALVGKPLVRASQEACTANLSYLLNKPFEDHSVHLLASPLNLNAAYDELMSAGQASSSYIASYFRSFVQTDSTQRVCLIDTPGVNSAINQEHGSLTRKALLEEKYDKLIYVLNANQLGTDEEIRYLKYVSEHVPKHKVIFVLNKVDNFKSSEDSIAASMEGIRSDLHQLGYDDPVICPLSAYFALLLKLKQNGERLSEDEQDAYDYYVKKFSRAEYDLSRYLDKSADSIQATEDEPLALAVKCGLYGLETLLYGGRDL
ncbi:dynamin family protein [Paenibacillus cellulosilyticus]|uniref:Dynamin family protein n=1 Tax=Paenibacillus cellulosilyticus TaxID=375489 RepID=A0A2V2YTY0_9BACL|nr:dynamin family protein [Paenibacillus cellulosilyticus]PWV99303.1 dynamin family protein [Paenibacillus cellulosilyticus]QKS45068.1 dynamin family protein [Paenibacillus cellulosilyticus]